MSRRHKYYKPRYDPVSFKQMAFLLGGLVVALFVANLQKEKGVEGMVATVVTLTVGAVILGFLALVFWMYWVFVYKKAKLRKLQLVDIDEMSGVDFERYVGEVLKFQGYQVTFTPATGDFGVDIVAEKEHRKTSIQLKRYRGLVGIDAVNQAVAGKGYYKCDSSMVITNSFFTPAAQRQAEANDTLLVDRETLIEWMVEFQTNKAEEQKEKDEKLSLE